MKREEIINKIKNFKNENFDFMSDFIESLPSDLIKDSKCFGDEEPMCVYAVEVENKKYYICDGYEWLDVTDDQSDVIWWFENYNEENPNKDEVEEGKERLRFFLNKQKQKGD